MTTRLKTRNPAIAAAGNTAMAATRREAAAGDSPCRHRAHTAAASAAAVTGHASYRVRQASANTQPTVRAGRFGPHGSLSVSRVRKRPGLLRLHQSNSIATARVIRPISSGSVIGVDCRYSTFGLSANTAAPATAAAFDPVS